MRRNAFSTSGPLPARPVSLVAAGNVNSGQLAIWGSGPLSASCLGGLTPIFASGRSAGCTRALGRGTQVLLSYGGRQLERRLWIVGFATLRHQTFGGKTRRITACNTA